MNGETVTRHNFLALREEHGFIREGFAFLDEKRMLLAQQILAEHADYRRRRTALATAWEAAIAALAEALGESGLLPLAVAAIPRRPPPLPELARHAHFGVPLLRLTTADDPAAARPAGWQTPQQRCAEAFARVTTAAAAVAASAGNLQRLVAEYRRTTAAHGRWRTSSCPSWPAACTWSRRPSRTASSRSRCAPGWPSPTPAGWYSSGGLPRNAPCCC
jgi:V/A-type H+-transporting ATPase subunit D